MFSPPTPSADKVGQAKLCNVLRVLCFRAEVGQVERRRRLDAKHINKFSELGNVLRVLEVQAEKGQTEVGN